MSCIFRGPPGPATPYARSECFQPPYALGSSPDQVNCISNWSSRGSCSYNAECGDIDRRCFRGQCAAFESNNPRVVAENAQGYMMEKNGTRFEAQPLHTQYNRNEPQCSTCLRTIWNCDRFPEASAEKTQCQRFEQCFLYDTRRPDGTLIPLAVKNSPECQGAVQAALQKCVTQCGSCIPTDALATGC